VYSTIILAFVSELLYVIRNRIAIDLLSSWQRQIYIGCMESLSLAGKFEVKFKFGYIKRLAAFVIVVNKIDNNVCDEDKQYNC